MARKKAEPTNPEPVIQVLRTIKFQRTVSETEVKRLLAETELAQNKALREAGVTLGDIEVKLLMQSYNDYETEFIGAELTVDKSERLEE